jgi:hypothetical protein
MEGKLPRERLSENKRSVLTNDAVIKQGKQSSLQEVIEWRGRASNVASATHSNDSSSHHDTSNKSKSRPSEVDDEKASGSAGIVKTGAIASSDEMAFQKAQESSKKMAARLPTDQKRPSMSDLSSASSIPVSTEQTDVKKRKKRRSRGWTFNDVESATERSNKNIKITKAGPFRDHKDNADKGGNFEDVDGKLISYDQASTGSLAVEGRLAKNSGLRREDAKAAEKREYNRVNAARARLRNKEMVEELQKNVIDLNAHIVELERSNEILRAQVEVLGSRSQSLLTTSQVPTAAAPEQELDHVQSSTAAIVAPSLNTPNFSVQQSGTGTGQPSPHQNVVAVEQLLASILGRSLPQLEQPPSPPALDNLSLLLTLVQGSNGASINSQLQSGPPQFSGAAIAPPTAQPLPSTLFAMNPSLHQQQQTIHSRARLLNMQQPSDPYAHLSSANLQSVLQNLPAETLYAALQQQRQLQQGDGPGYPIDDSLRNKNNNKSSSLGKDGR